jgi:hypothetical protein
MPKVTLFETDLSLDLDFVETCEDDYIKPGMVFTMNYILTATVVQVTVVSIRRVLEDQYGDVYLLGCVLKPEIPIYTCESGTQLAHDIRLSSETAVPIAVGHMLKILE